MCRALDTWGCYLGVPVELSPRYARCLTHSIFPKFEAGKLVLRDLMQGLVWTGLLR